MNNQDQSQANQPSEVQPLGSLSLTPGSAFSVHPRFDEAHLPAPGEQIGEHAECPACGHTSADFGRWRKAESYEEADADGEIYECGYCGENRIIPPLPNAAVSRADQ